MLSFPAQPSWQIARSAILTTNPRIGKARFASLIVPRLYLSDYFTAIDGKQLSKLGITHVISILERVPAIPECIPEDRRLHVSIADHADVDILQYLDKTTEFIRACLENEENNVLVHCFQGVSRSATVVCAYLVATTSMTAPQSIAYVQAKRSIVCPNSGFRNQLDTYSVQFHGNGAKRSGSRMSRMTEGIAERIRELKAVAGAPPTSVKRGKPVVS